MTLPLITITFGMWTFFVGYVFSKFKRHKEDRKLGRTWWRLVSVQMTAIPYIAGIILMVFCYKSYPPAMFWAVPLAGFVMWSIANFMNNCSHDGIRYYIYVLIGPSVYYFALLVMFYTSQTVMWIQP